MLSRQKRISLVWMGSILLWMLLTSSLAVLAEEQGVGETIPPLHSFQKTVRSETGQVGVAYNKQVVTYTISIWNTTEPSYTARIGVTDTVPLSLPIDAGTIQSSKGDARLAPGNQITWVLDVEAGDVHTLTYAARTPTVTVTTAFTNMADLYEISNKWVATPTTVTTSTLAVLLVRPDPKLYLPLVSRSVEELRQLDNYRFEDGPDEGWGQAPEALIYNREGKYPFPRDGNYVAWLGGAPSQTNELSQTLKLPTDYVSLGLTYLYLIDSAENSPSNDKAEVRITADGVDSIVERPPLTRGNSLGWQRHVIYLAAFKGKETTFTFWTELNDTLNSNFFVDKVEICSNDELTNPPDVRRCDNTDIP